MNSVLEAQFVVMEVYKAMEQLFANLPAGKYNTVVIDPPWKLKTIGKKKHLPGKRNHNQTRPIPYKMMSLDEIKQFPLSDLTNVGAHVYLWTTNSMLRAAFDVLEAWGVHYHLTIPLVKKSGIAPCNGYVFAAEYCLLGFAGKPMQKFTAVGKLNWLVSAPRPGMHSQKPDEFYELVSAMSPEPRLDCFSRRRLQGWDTWGNEKDKDDFAGLVIS
jgi:N6-adenosine-specific RNA methylase IME4